MLNSRYHALYFLSRMGILLFGISPLIVTQYIQAGGIAAEVQSRTDSVEPNTRTSSVRNEVTRSWSQSAERLEVKTRGEIELTDDDSDVKSISNDGYLLIKEERDGVTRKLVVVQESDGSLGRSFFVAGESRAYDREAATWMARVLLRLIRGSGFLAPARIKRILAQRGGTGVLNEISLIQGDFVKRIYFTKLLRSGSLDFVVLQQAIEQAGREISADFELATVLSEAAKKDLRGDPVRLAYVQAASGIGAAFQHWRVLQALLEQNGLSTVVIKAILQDALKIGSDFELAELLIKLARLRGISEDTRPAFLRVLDKINSDFQRHRVLATVGN